MNPTLASAKAALGIETNAEFARFLGLPRQSMTGRDEAKPIPDAWCWKAAQKRPDLFAPAPAPKGKRRKAIRASDSATESAGTEA
ncbi:TPA: hypothetical protein ACOEPF_000400 [Stenotrophomonas maltophilia]|jgi:hypothetical protein|uniref:hypothetical protein n=1 Tax=Stenotrophomonas TaxID=40323 RepID=UPI00201CE163|nr:MULTISPECIES: hypothetical protein [Stenotrophomonas]MBN5024519.1 hypothetical protein [Stenotrophomonas maltophilia]MDH1484944.1 hypothetical protein [Stenotrophomonas sp. GD03712]UQY95810.1 hypothetical protein LZ605_00125 [Stenotrophomonas maltophilia]UQY98126.1 hypothetical protein LZ605_22480 [Stenotrophomonas maltophilia]UQY98209.1 hypothetical protein LZ605_22845 [Stenotrophomonas maltophilia]